MQIQESEKTLFKVYVWPDGSFHVVNEEGPRDLEEAIQFKGDDYETRYAYEFEEDGTPVYVQPARADQQHVPLPFIGSVFDAELQDSGD